VAERTEALDAFLDANRVGVLATEAADGRPRQSLVYYARDGDTIVISSVAGRHKVADVERTGWASLCVMGHEQPYPSAVLAGTARIRTEGIGAATALVMQRVAGADEAPEPQTDEALAEVGRVILELGIERVTAVSYV
jgi:PPOX class probable F420-dependent enzyme